MSFKTKIDRILQDMKHSYKEIESLMKETKN